MADIYADSEDVVGEWIKRSGKREDIFLATKFGLQRQPEGSYKSRTDQEYVKAACGKSLQRIAVDTIDFYYSHRMEWVTPIKKIVGAMVEPKK
ncbi:NADP-dependent oxidoreductase domain-containing protein [Penicillium riverlandense]|uniref:NADP-dependent oxidoreductase domain-containing protein n=1 Tax=Penicillium riverlandense TaxID=1903569 RepID=UPI002549B2BC|nr:NADP-dependent oxidoreductase domain-containing protein [Penicillium riverlandense]KAJ5814593.1 NADP-dependent oxidoreductase domain-containing protein [Penicillium riverlandense]